MSEPKKYYTCEDCIHCVLCENTSDLLAPELCDFFKERTRYFELPIHFLVVENYNIGDICIYSFGDINKSLAIVQIVRILDDKRGIAEVKFLKVIVDDTGNDYFEYLLLSGKTMNVSLQYLTNITPRLRG